MGHLQRPTSLTGHNVVVGERPRTPRRAFSMSGPAVSDSEPLSSDEEDAAVTGELDLCDEDENPQSIVNPTTGESRLAITPGDHFSTDTRVELDGVTWATACGAKLLMGGSI